MAEEAEQNPPKLVPSVRISSCTNAMKVSKEERARLTAMMQQELMRLSLANRTEKVSTEKRRRRNHSFFRRVVSWAWIKAQGNREPVTAAKAAVSAK